MFFICWWVSRPDVLQSSLPLDCKNPINAYWWPLTRAKISEKVETYCHHGCFTPVERLEWCRVTLNHGHCQSLVQPLRSPLCTSYDKGHFRIIFLKMRWRGFGFVCNVHVLWFLFLSRDLICWSISWHTMYDEKSHQCFSRQFQMHWPSALNPIC